MKKKFIFLAMLILVLTTSIVFAKSFSDLPEGHWAYESINEMMEKGILNGYPDGTFLPSKNVTRAEFAKILVLSLELEEKTDTNFEDVKEDFWGYDYIKIANKYLNGYEANGKTYYMPNEPAVREDITAAMVIASGLENKDYNLNTLNKFSDKDKISEGLKKYVAIAVENGLLQGNADGTFNPKGNLTRAEASKVMFNALNLDIQVEEKIVYGDVNGDNRINNTDLTKLSSYFKNTSTKINEKAADVNLDGKIDEIDYYMIKLAYKGKIDLPHNCGSSYKLTFEEKNDSNHYIKIDCDCNKLLKYTTLTESHNFKNDKCQECDFVKTEEEHECEESKNEYVKIDEKNHKVLVICECKKILKETLEAHKYGNGKCVCGAEEKVEEKIIYGDVNGDGIVGAKDTLRIYQHIEGTNIIKKDSLEFKCADVNKDEKIDKFDNWLIYHKRSGTIELPHLQCNDYNIEYVEYDNNNHKYIEVCECKKLKTASKTEAHKFENGKCACGLEDILYGDVNGDGEVNMDDVTPLVVACSNYIGNNTYKKEADLNLDGKISTLDDFQILIYHLAYREEYEKLPYLGEMKQIDETNIKMGDINSNGIITQNDVKFLKALIDGYGFFEVEDFKMQSDLDSNNVINEDDVTILQSYIDGKIKELPHSHTFINSKCVCGAVE